LNIFFHCDQGVLISINNKIECQFLISKFRQKFHRSSREIYTIYKYILQKLNQKKHFFVWMCVREEIHSQGRSSRCWEKIHTGFFWMQKNKGFFLFIFMINNSAVKWLISEKMNSKWGAGNPVWNQGGFLIASRDFPWIN
jgi:hypothetical protein